MEQLELWSDPVYRDATADRDASRDRWQATRLRYPVGSEEEVAAWRAYQEAAERLTAIIRAKVTL
jgi:hypothetical protein